MYKVSYSFKRGGEGKKKREKGRKRGKREEKNEKRKKKRQKDKKNRCMVGAQHVYNLVDVLNCSPLLLLVPRVHPAPVSAVVGRPHIPSLEKGFFLVRGVNP